MVFRQNIVPAAYISAQCIARILVPNCFLIKAIVIKKIHKTHQVFYLRCHNLYSVVNFGNNRFCKYLEVSYIIKKDYDFTNDPSIYPIKEFDLVDFSKLIPKNGEMNLNILKLFDNNN
jgi:hypothetical protein